MTERSAYHRYQGRSFFWLALATILSGIAVTLLFANNQRNLEQLASLVRHQRGIDVTVDAFPFSKTRRIRLNPHRLPAHLLSQPQLKVASTFISANLYPGGRELCATLKKQGIDVSTWAPDLINKRSNSCSWERVFGASRVRPAGQERLFVIVKGRNKFEAGTIRIKFSTSADGPSSELTATLVRALEAIDQASGWPDIKRRSLLVANLMPLDEEHFGIGMRFRQEASQPGSFNLIMSASLRSEPAKRTMTYFDPSDHLQARQDLVSTCLRRQCWNLDKTVAVRVIYRTVNKDTQLPLRLPGLEAERPT